MSVVNNIALTTQNRLITQTGEVFHSNFEKPLFEEVKSMREELKELKEKLKVLSAGNHPPLEKV